MFGPRTFDCDLEPQVPSANAFCSVKLWVYNFDSASDASRNPVFSVYIGFHILGLIS